MKKTLLLSSLLLCSGIAMAQGQQQPTSIQDMMREHLTKELQRHGITQGQPARPTDKKPVMGVKAPAPLVAKATTTELRCDSTITYNEIGNFTQKTIHFYDAEGYLTTSYNYSYYDDWYLTSKKETTHYDNGCIESETYYTWRDEAWSPSSLYEYTYDDRNRQNSYTSYYYMIDKWVGSFKSEYSYDDNDFQIYYASYQYNSGTQQWEGRYKNETVYDQKGRQIYYAYYDGWDNGQWIGQQKSESAYDEFDNQILYAWYYWDNGDWVGQYKYENFYDAEGYETGYAAYNWQGSDWFVIEESKIEYTYGDNGKRVERIVYIKSFDQWLPQYRIQYTYNEQGLVEESVEANYYEGEWNPSFKRELSYDASGYLFVETDYYYNPMTNEWMNANLIDYIHDEQGNLLRQMTRLWNGEEWIGYDLYEYEYDSLGRQTSYTRYAWKDGDWQGIQHFENTYDDFGHQTHYANYAWIDGEWVKTTVGDTYYNEFGEYAGSTNYETFSTYEGPMTLEVNLAGSQLSNLIDDEDLLFTGKDYKVNALYVDEYVGGELETETQITVLWQNDGSMGPISWDGEYRFSSQENATTEECYAFEWDDWMKLKTGTFYVDLVGDYPQIRVTSGWWTTNWTGDDIFPGSPYLEDHGDGTWTLTVNLEGDPLLDVIDQQHLLFTGDGYTVQKIYLAEQVPVPTRVDLWQNDGSLGEIFWNGLYRFSNQENASTEECYAFTAEEWNIIKNNTFYVELAGDYPHIRVTSGWWSTIWTGDDIYPGSPYLEDHYDGTWTLTVNLEGDPLLDVIDQEHLLFTGEGYIVKSIHAKVSNNDNWQRRCIWQYDGTLGYTATDDVYRFGREGHEENCVATFNDTDWSLIKQGHLTAEIEAIEPRAARIIVTTSRWSLLLTGSAISYGSPLLSGKEAKVLAGTGKYVNTFDEMGNTTSYTVYNWDWLNKDWAIVNQIIYYYSEHEVNDIEQILSDLRPRLRKELRNGQVRIVVGQKVYNLEGQEIAK